MRILVDGLARGGDWPELIETGVGLYWEGMGLRFMNRFCKRGSRISCGDGG